MKTLSNSLQKAKTWLSFLVFLAWLGVTNAQTDINQAQDNISKRFSTFRDSLRSNKLLFAGNLNSLLSYTISKEDPPVFDYNFNINLQIGYKGLKLPFQYTYSNGRSIYRFNGPSIRTPSFKAIGLSPAYKGFMLHAGNRMMEFSKYTYQNVRFNGIGFETPEKGLYIKAYKGTLKVLRPSDLIYRSNAELDYTRRSWGMLFGYTNEELDLKAIIFKANDDPDSRQSEDSIIISPKENTVISYVVDFEPSEHFSFHIEQSLSALTHDALSPRIEILTPQTTKNLLGLFEKKESSRYYLSRHIEAKYIIKEQSISFINESVDKDYRSLGSLFFDNNFNENKVKVAGNLEEIFDYSISAGMRNLKTIKDSLAKDSKFVINSLISCRWSKHLMTFGSFSNFKTVQNNYYRSFNSSSVDSLVLSQVNNLVSFGTNYITKGDYPHNFGLMLSSQSSNSIQDEIVGNAKTMNRVVTITYSRSIEKKQMSGSIAYINTFALANQTKSFTTSMQYGFDMNDKTNLSSSLQYNSISFSNLRVHQIVAQLNLEYLFDTNKSLSVEAGLDFSDANQKFNVKRILCQANVQIKL